MGPVHLNSQTENILSPTSVQSESPSDSWPKVTQARVITQMFTLPRVFPYTLEILQDLFTLVDA